MIDWPLKDRQSSREVPYHLGGLPANRRNGSG